MDVLDGFVCDHSAIVGRPLALVPGGGAGALLIALADALRHRPKAEGKAGTALGSPPVVAATARDGVMQSGLDLG